MAQHWRHSNKKFKHQKQPQNEQQNFSKIFWGRDHIADPVTATTHNRSTVFARWLYVLYIYTSHPIPPKKLVPFHHSMSPPEPPSKNGTSIESAIFPHYTVITNGQTDRQTELKWEIDRYQHTYRSAMRPKNSRIKKPATKWKKNYAYRHSEKTYRCENVTDLYRHGGVNRRYVPCDVPPTPHVPRTVGTSVRT